MQRNFKRKRCPLRQSAKNYPDLSLFLKKKGSMNRAQKVKVHGREAHSHISGCPNTPIHRQVDTAFLPFLHTKKGLTMVPAINVM